jgi:hypothetical protein
LAIARAAGDRGEFVRSLAGRRAYVTDPDPRPATAVVVGSYDGDALATYEVEEHELWNDGLPGPSYAMFAFFRAPARLEGDAFVREYREHAAVARAQHPGIRVYRQNIVLAFEGEERWRCDGISELHFASRDEFRERFWLNDASRDVIAADVLRFSDASTAKQLVGSELFAG